MTDPRHLAFSEDHLWVRPQRRDSLVRWGSLTSPSRASVMSSRDPPEAGATVEAGEACGEIESTKSVSDLVTPITGAVRARNEDLDRVAGPREFRSIREGLDLEVESRSRATARGQFAALMDPPPTAT